MIPFYQRISRIIFKICFSLSCSPIQVTKQNYFGKFTCPLKHCGRPNPPGQCWVTPLPLQGPSGLGLLDTDGKCCLRTYLKKALVTTTDNNEFSVCFTCGYILSIRI